MNVHYRLLTTRGVAVPLAICAGALAALPFLGGLPLPSVSRAPAAVQPTPGVQRVSHEVYVPNVGRGCRWQPSSDPTVQIAECGDDSDSVRVVFKDGRVSEYRLIARQDPTKPSAAQSLQTGAPQSSAASAGAAPGQQPVQPVQPGRLIPSSGAPPLRVTVTAGG